MLHSLIFIYTLLFSSPFNGMWASLTVLLLLFWWVFELFVFKILQFVSLCQCYHLLIFSSFIYKILLHGMQVIFLQPIICLFSFIVIFLIKKVSVLLSNIFIISYFVTFRLYVYLIPFWYF